jgi:hypothetical protein
VALNHNLFMFTASAGNSGSWELLVDLAWFIDGFIARRLTKKTFDSCGVTKFGDVTAFYYLNM